VIENHLFTDDTKAFKVGSQTVKKRDQNC